MDQTKKKVRKGPTASATLFPVGTVRTGNDGNKWMVEANKNGVHRWVLTKKGTRKAGKAGKAKKVEKETRDTCYIDYKQSKQCQGKEEGACDPFMSEKSLDAIGWTMGFPNYSDNKAYDFSIYIEGPSETKAEAKAIVTKAYTKIKARGAIDKFRVSDA
jgi:hypothetical protein